jgi:hypothetical protein
MTYTYDPTLPANTLKDEAGNAVQVAPADYNSARAEAAPYLDAKTSRDYLAKIGVDTSSMDDTQVKSLAFMGWYQDYQNKNNKPIMPPPTTQAEMDQFMTQAQQELAPTYANDLNIARKDIEYGLSQFIPQVQDASAARMATVQQEKEQLASDMAEAGLTYSDIRKRAEAQLGERQGRLIRSEASQYAQRMREGAAQYEKTYGPQELSKLQIPSLSYAGIKIQPPALYGVPAGFGTQQVAQKTAEIGRQGDLIQAQQQKRQAEATYAAGKPL